MEWIVEKSDCTKSALSPLELKQVFQMVDGVQALNMADCTKAQPPFFVAGSTDALTRLAQRLKGTGWNTALPPVYEAA